MKRYTLLCALVLASSSSCTEVNPDPMGAMPGPATECVPTAETELNCGDGIDDDCNGAIDCGDGACIENDACTSGSTEGCGEATHGGDPLAIPDGVGMSYETSITIDGFTNGQVLQSVDGFVSVCVEMEHSWLRDLQIEFECPSGEIVVLQEFLGHTGSQLYMGIPNDDDGFEPTPGTGWNYCWSPTAINAPMLDYANANPTLGTLPEGEYQASDSFDLLLGCQLNGDWTIRATDDWGIDNGYIFGWTVNFNQDIIADCSDWVE